MISFLNRLENLAWATAQVHCYCSSATDERAIEAKTSKNVAKAAIVTADTALNTQQGQGNVALETKPKILFCDLRLSPGETRSCNTTFEITFQFDVQFDFNQYIRL